MHLLYLDDSGSIDDPNSRFFVLAGMSIFERQTHWLDSHITSIASRFDAAYPENIELHAGPMRTGKEGWQRFSPADRVQAVVDTLNLLGDPQLKVRVFASVIEKPLLQVHQIIPEAFEKISCCFDDYLAARYQLSKGRDPQRGIVIFDNSMFEQRIQSLSHMFKHQGHTSGRLRNFAEVPLFIDSKASRLIQMADLIAYWIYRRYQSGDYRGFLMIEPYIHGFNGRKQGLYELVSPETVSRMERPDPPTHPFPRPTAAGLQLAPVIPRP